MNKEKENLVYEFLRYSGRYGETLGYLRNILDTFSFVEGLKDGYSGLPFTDNNLLYLRTGVSLADRLRFCEMDKIISENDENVKSLDDKLCCEDKNKFYPQVFKGLVKDDIARPLIFAGVGYGLGSIGRYFS